MSYAQRGRQRERQVAEKLRADGWVVLKGTSFGVCDLAAMRADDPPMLIEVKSTSRPYERFQPAERAVMVQEAARAGATAVLAWWPPRRPMKLIPASEWPA